MKKLGTVEYNSEEDVKIQMAIPYLEGLGYKRDCMEFEKTIQVHEGKKKKSIFADIVIYSNKKKETPLIVVDTKSPKEILSKQERDQVISYARLLPQIAPLAMLTNGYQTHVYQTIDKTRIKDLPEKKVLLKDFIDAVISQGIQTALRQEATKELFIIDDVNVFKDLLKKCHNIIRNNEGYDPIQAFDEMSKVLFSKMYEEQRNKDSNRFTSEIFDKTLKELHVNIVQQQFSEIQKEEGFRDLFPRGTTIELNDRTIKEIVSIFEKYDLTLTKFDVKGEAYEYFLSDTFTGGLGEYFTPRNVVEFIVESISPRIGDKIIDPFCGTGGFLIYAFDIVSEKINIQDFTDSEKNKWRVELSNRSLYGTDWKPRTSQTCKMNMIVHGDGNTGIFQHNGFLNIPGKIEEGIFDICFTNPPFGAIETDIEVLNNFELGSGRMSQKREILAVERCIKLVKKKTGIVAFILPDGILNNDSFDYVREYINKEVDVLGVIGLNKETFEGYNATVKTSILIMRRKEIPRSKNNHKVFMAVCTNSGYAPTGQQVAGNQLPDILFDFRNYYLGLNEKPIFKYCSIVKINEPSDRIDAERYIKHEETDQLLNHSDLSGYFSERIGKVNQISLDVNKVLQKIYTSEEFDYISISDFIKPISNPIALNKEAQYIRLGVSGNGLGVFKKEPCYGREIKAKYLNKVKSGTLVYSRLFAKNGSFGYIDENTTECYISSEFPTFEVITKKYEIFDLLEYLVFYLSSPQVISYINRLTTGSTKQSRGRFKENQLLSMKIPMPKKKSIFDEIIKSIRLLKNLQTEIRDVSEKIKTLPKSFKLSFPEVQE